jgi:hypothetical protein
VALPEETNNGIDLSPVLDIELTTRIASPFGLEEVNRVSTVPVLLITIPLSMLVDAVLFEKLARSTWPTPASTLAPPAHTWPWIPDVETADSEAMEMSPPPE